MKSPLIALALLVASSAWSQTRVARLSALENRVEVTQGTSSDAFSSARLNQGLFEQQHLRTYRRARAAMAFLDGAALKVNQRTELVIQASATLKKIGLTQGAVWMKVPKGQQVSVETPLLTASVRGTEFEVDAQEGVRVYEGMVEVFAGGQNFQVNPGQYVRRTPEGWLLAPIPDRELPFAYSGPEFRWWETLKEGRQNNTGTESTYVDAQNSELPYRYVAEKGAGPLAGGADGWISRFASRPDEGYWPAAFGIAGVGPIRSAAANGQIAGLAGSPGYGYGRVTTGVNAGDTLYNVGVEGWTSAGVSKGQVGVLATRPGSNLTLTSGRGPLHFGPATLDTLGLGVAHDSYSHIAAHWDEGPWRAQMAYITDVDGFQRRSQPGYGASLKAYLGVATIGAAYMETAHRRSNRASVSLAADLIPNQIQMYGEWTRGGGGFRGGETFGAYLSGLAEATDIDVFVEHQEERGVGRAWSLLATKEMNNNVAVGVHAEFVGKRRHWGAGFKIRF